MNTRYQSRRPISVARAICSAGFFTIAVFSQSGLIHAQAASSRLVDFGWGRSINQAIDQSNRTGRPIMLVFSGSDWCHWCQKLEREVLRTAEFDRWLADRVIKVLVDFPQGHQLPPGIARQNNYLKDYFAAHVDGFQTVLMIRSDGAVIGKAGFVPGGPGAWIAKANSILNPLRRVASSGIQD